jgi:hypothetical protein
MRTIDIAVAALCAATLAGCGAALDQTVESPGGVAAEAETQTAAEPTSKEPAAEPEPAESEPELTVAQENARESAESYLELSGFSKKGLVEQLEFEGYEKADIDAALATMTVDWKAEAVESAESYLDMTSFSRQGLIEQLEFEGYTSKQAKHAADAVGL